MKRFLLTVALIFVMFSGYSQIWRYQRYEVWGAVSVYQYFGDIGGTPTKNNLMGLKDFKLSSLRPGISFGANYRFKERWYFQLSNSFVSISQTDIGSRNEARGFSFSTLINETSIRGMYYFIKEADRSYSFTFDQSISGVKQALSFYGFAGLSNLYIRVTSNGKPDPRFVSNKHFALGIPIGLGGKFCFTPKILIAAELSLSPTTSDYLDGLSTESSKYKDKYLALNFKFIYRIPRAKPYRPRF